MAKELWTEGASNQDRRHISVMSAWASVEQLRLEDRVKASLSLRTDCTTPIEIVPARRADGIPTASLACFAR
eukprot:4944968-Pleurochrysis_carterae.AAC.1